MSRLIWDAVGERLYETGVKKGVLYPQVNGAYPKGYVWNGLISVSESPSGAEASPLYADDIKYLNLMSAEEFGASIEAYTYPREFAECDGSAAIAPGMHIGQQRRKLFGLAYRTTLGNDVDSDSYGYKLHLIYGALASPSEKGYNTISDSPEAITFSWEVTTTPVEVPGFKPTATLTIDSTENSPEVMAQIEDILYGTASSDPRLPLPDELAALAAVTTYAVTGYYTNVENTNTVSSISGEYEGTLSAKTGYAIANVVVLMGGVDITNDAYDSATGGVSIDSVTGPIVIYATANASV